MQLERFTLKAQEALAAAQKLARSAGTPRWSPSTSPSPCWTRTAA